MDLTPAFHAGRFPLGGIPRINRPLAQRFGCVAAYYPAAYANAPLPNLATPGLGTLTTNGGGAIMASTPDGMGINLTGTATNVYLTGLCPVVLQLPGKFSAFVRMMWTGNAGTNLPASIFGVTFTGTGSGSPFWSWLIAATPPSAPAQRISIGYCVSSSGFVNNTLSTPSANPALVAGQMTSVGITFPAAATGTQLITQCYQDGAFYNSNNNQNTGFYGASPQIVLGDPSGRGRNVSSIVTVAYIFNNPKSLADFHFLDTNPYAMLSWNSDMVFDELVHNAAAPPVSNTTSRSILWSPLTIAGAGVGIEKILRRNPLLTRRKTLLGRWK